MRSGLGVCVLGSEIYAGDWGLVNWDPRCALRAGGVYAGIRDIRSELGACVRGSGIRKRGACAVRSGCAPAGFISIAGNV